APQSSWRSAGMGKGPQVPQSAINSMVNLQNTESGLLTQYSNIALPLLNSAGNYWQALMQGGPAAQAATAPYAERIAGQTAAAQKQIQSNLPAGGEKNLALAELPIQSNASIANLYAGLGPQAASMIQSLALGSAGAGTGSGGVSAAAGGSNENLAATQAASKNNMFGGIGSGLGQIAGTSLGSKGTGTGALGGKAAGGAGKAAGGAAAGKGAGAAATDLLPLLAA